MKETKKVWAEIEEAEKIEIGAIFLSFLFGLFTIAALIARFVVAIPILLALTSLFVFLCVRYHRRHLELLEKLIRRTYG